MSARRISRETAVGALRCVALVLEVAPGELTAADYRAVRTRAEFRGRLPSDLSIRLLYGGWARACGDAARGTWRRTLEGGAGRELLGTHPDRRGP